MSERFQEGLVLKDDLLGAVDGGNVVDAAHQDQVQRARDRILELVDEARVAVMDLTSC